MLNTFKHNYVCFIKSNSVRSVHNILKNVRSIACKTLKYKKIKSVLVSLCSSWHLLQYS